MLADVILSILVSVLQEMTANSIEVPSSPSSSSSALPLATSCLPNTQFYFNGLSCVCDGTGRWSSGDCRSVGRPCRPGHVTWQGCNYCICQEDGQTTCTYTTCSDVAKSSILFNATNGRKYRRSSSHLETIGNSCTPFRYYYVNCNLCICPPNGLSTEAHCKPDPSCTYSGSHDIAASLRTKKTNHYCIPNVMYIFQCLHCPCSDDGMINTDKCTEKCNNTVLAKTDNILRCSPGTFFKHNNQICSCAEDGLARKSRCGESTDKSKLRSLDELQANKSFSECVPNTFTKKRCVYCDCNANGTINHGSCLEQSCQHLSEDPFTGQVDKCKPGEVVPLCIECFCFHNKTTSDRFCITSCSIRSKIKILEKLREENSSENSLILQRLIHVSADNRCKANMIFFDKSDSTLCFCPDTGKKSNTLCIPIVIEEETRNEANITNNFNATCVPFTMVNFDCNTCFCTKNGSIDPKWCTYDDCNQIKEVVTVNNAFIPTKAENCTAGSISYAGCNFCLCVKSAQGTQNVCTNHSCEGNLTTERTTLDFACTPFSYYQVDCNMCLCPANGLKNVYMCTEKVCEKSFLRTDACLPGHLFSDSCNICVCSQSGSKRDMLCTKRTCHDEVAPWKSLLQRSGTLMTARSASDTRSLDLCFPGEEFEQGCSQCVCPEMGLRAFAECTESNCDGQDQELIPEEFAEFVSFFYIKALCF